MIVTGAQGPPITTQLLWIRIELRALPTSLPAFVFLNFVLFRLLYCLLEDGTTLYPSFIFKFYTLNGTDFQSILQGFFKVFLNPICSFFVVICFHLFT